jgi:hypothetical protein
MYTLRKNKKLRKQKILENVAKFMLFSVVPTISVGNGLTWGIHTTGYVKTAEMCTKYKKENIEKIFVTLLSHLFFLQFLCC